MGLQLLLAEIWQLLEQAAIPAPSHRNRTMTDWAARMERAKAMLVDAQNAAMDADIEMRQLAAVRKLNESASAHHQALANEIARLRGENRLILDALGMEKYRVRWRPVSDEGFKAMGGEMLIVYNSPLMSAGEILITRWFETFEWGALDARFVTHWAPLPGLPEEVG